MKMLKKIALLLLAFAALFFLVALFLPQNARVQSTCITHVSPAVVFKQINKLKNWENWSPFLEANPHVSYTYEGPELGAGAIQKWTGEAKGEMSIVESRPYSLVKMDVDFYGQGKAGMWFFFNEKADSTEVAWVMEMEGLDYPLGRYRGLFMQRPMRKIFAKGLANLAAYCKGLPELPKIEMQTMEPAYGIAIRDSAYAQDIGEKMGMLYGKLTGYMKRYGIVPTGPPFTIYYTWDESKPFLMDVGMPVAKNTKGRGPVKYMVIEGGNVVVAWHYGAYEKTGDTHRAVWEYMLEHKLEMNGFPWESYITDPVTETDTDKWLTKIYWPVK